jgi:DNA-directed RNA polymerase specialized sigma24 family protein
LNEGEDLPDLSQNRPDDEVLEQERKAILERCLKRLQDRSAALIRGRLEGASYKDLCAKLKLEPKPAYKLFHEAMKQLQACVNEPAHETHDHGHP